MMRGTVHQQWEVYRADAGEPLYGEMLAYGLTMTEAVRYAFEHLSDNGAKNETD
jgi:hypothetical protein